MCTSQYHNYYQQSALHTRACKFVQPNGDRSVPRLLIVDELRVDYDDDDDDDDLREIDLWLDVYSPYV